MPCEERHGHPVAIIVLHLQFPCSDHGDLPPLRQRVEDIPTLVWHFTSVYARRMNKSISEISPDTMRSLVQYPWPGNVRELQNFIERSVILSPHSVLRAPVLELESLSRSGESRLPLTSLAQFEHDHILRALELSNWIVGGRNGAAAQLGMKRTSLVYRMQKFGITRPTPRPKETIGGHS